MKYSKEIYNDAENTFFIVCEATTPEDNSGFEILKKVETPALSFLRFSSCLQAFHGNRNRNGRLWLKDHIVKMIADNKIDEALKTGSFVGEAGHPVPDTGKVTLERILTIDPLRTSHRITNLEWRGNQLHGTVETLDEGPGTPGVRFMRNILQGIIPAFSLRSVVPQRKNPDRTIDVLGPGIMKCYDRVYGPSHPEAYQDVDIPVKNVVSGKKFEVVAESAAFAPAMESYVEYLFQNSDKSKYVLDGVDIAMESATINPNTGMVTVKTSDGIIGFAPELKHRRDIRGILSEYGI